MRARTNVRSIYVCVCVGRDMEGNGFFPYKIETTSLRSLSVSLSLSLSLSFTAATVAERAFTERLLITLFMPGDRTVERLTFVRPLQRGSALYGIVPRPKTVLYAVNLLKFNSPPLNIRRGFINGNTLLAINSAACRVRQGGVGGGRGKNTQLIY